VIRTIDLSDAYEQIHIIPEDMHKMVFATIYRTFVSNVMQQGDCNVPSTFQCAMNSIFCEYIRIFLHVYLDDLFVYSNSSTLHSPTYSGRNPSRIMDSIRNFRTLGDIFFGVFITVSG